MRDSSPTFAIRIARPPPSPPATATPTRPSSPLSPIRYFQIPVAPPAPLPLPRRPVLRVPGPPSPDGSSIPRPAPLLAFYAARNSRATSAFPYVLTSVLRRVLTTPPAAALPRSHRKAATISNVPCSVVSFQRPSAGKTLPVACFRRFAIPPQPISVFRVGAAPDKENPYPPAATRRNGSESPR